MRTTESKKINVKLFFVLVATMLVVIYPRFDRQDRFGIDQFTSKGQPSAIALADAGKYINHVKFFRGEVGSESLRAPWAYRPLPTFLASFVPLKPITAINVINFIFLFLGLLFLLKSLAILGISATTTALGGFAYVVSFPVFFYGAIGYIDPVLVGMLSIGHYLVLSKKHLLFFSLLFLGAFVKDPYIIILPAWAAYQYSLAKSSWFRIALVTISAMLIFILTIYVIRAVSPVSDDFFWVPSKTLLEFNLFRVNAWLTWLLTFGPMGFIAVWFSVKENFALIENPALISLAVGLAGALAVLAYSFFSVYLDGRYIWIAYPFMIPLACQYLDMNRLESRLVGNMKSKIN